MQSDGKDSYADCMYLVDILQLNPCDIVLMRGHTLVSKGIASATGGHFSHAMVNVGMSLIHAERIGVFSKNPQRVLVNNKKDIAVLRLNRRLSTVEIEAIINYARSQVGNLYSKLEAVKTVTNPKGCAKSQHQFCSRLVAQAYFHAGIKIVKNPNYCSPNDLLHSDNLIQIDAIKLADKKDRALTCKKDIPYINQVATFEWVNKSRKFAYRKTQFIINTLSDVYAFIEMHPEYSDNIVAFIEETSYLKNYQLDREANPYRFSVEMCLELFRLDKNKTIDLLMFDMKQEYEVCMLQLNNVKGCKESKQSTYIKTMYNLACAVVEFSLEKIRTFVEVFKILNLLELLEQTQKVYCFLLHQYEGIKR